MRPDIRPKPAIILLVLISAIVYSVLLTASNDKELVHEQDGHINLKDKRDVVFAHSSGKQLWAEPNKNGKYDYKKPHVVYWHDEDGETTEYYSAKELVHEQEGVIVDIDKKYHGGKNVICDTCPLFDNCFSGPNEPEFLTSDTTTNHSYNLFNNVTQAKARARLDLENHIPTWPDYIELEKDLILRWDYPEPNNHMVILVPPAEWIVSKGTKIYFKNDK